MDDATKPPERKDPPTDYAQTADELGLTPEEYERLSSEATAQRTETIRLQAATIRKLKSKLHRMRPQQPGQGADPHGIQLVSLGDMLAMPRGTTKFVVQDLLPVGGTSIAGGRPKVGKTTLVHCLALAVARGYHWLGRECEKGTVVYLGLEEKFDEFVEHMAAIGGAQNDPIHSHIGRAPQGNPVDILEPLIESHEPSLVIVDTLFKLVRMADGDSYSDTTAALEPIMELARDTNTHILFTHHNRKAGGHHGDELLGSTGLLGGVDTLISYDRSADDVRTIYSVNRYGQDLEKSVVELDAGWIKVTGTKAEVAMIALEDEILEFIGDQAAQPVPGALIQREVTGQTQAKSKALKGMVHTKRLIQTKADGKGGALFYRLP